MTIIPWRDVEDLRARVTNAHVETATRFRELFEQTESGAGDPLRQHMTLLANSLIRAARHLTLAEGSEIRILLRDDRTVLPFVSPGGESQVGDDAEPRDVLFRWIQLDGTAAAVLEYWMIISEILGSAAWRMTRLIASGDEFREALDRMLQPQLIRPLFLQHEPVVELRDDSTATLEVTLYSRAGEERIERRHLVLDDAQEFHLHHRDILAEGSGGVVVR